MNGTIFSADIAVLPAGNHFSPMHKSPRPLPAATGSTLPEILSFPTTGTKLSRLHCTDCTAAKTEHSTACTTGTTYPAAHRLSPAAERCPAAKTAAAPSRCKTAGRQSYFSAFVLVFAGAAQGIVDTDTDQYRNGTDTADEPKQTAAHCRKRYCQKQTQDLCKQIAAQSLCKIFEFHIPPPMEMIDTAYLSRQRGY